MLGFKINSELFTINENLFQINTETKSPISLETDKILTF